MEKYNVEDMIKCKVTGIEKYGIFVSVNEEYSGLIHISEISEGFVRNVNDFVQIGEEITAKIMEITEVDKHMKLSIKNLNYRDEKMKYKIKESANGFQPLKESLMNWVEEKMTKL